MLKLLKYEFRKSLTALLVLAAVVGAVEIYFLGAMALNNTDHMAYAMLLMAICVYAAMIFVFVRGLTTYAGELKSRSAYLIFMTPNSGLKIMASKYVYTFVNGLLIGAACLLLAGLNVTLFFARNGDLEQLLRMADTLLSQMGLYLNQMGLFIAVTLITALLSLLRFFALAYLAITLSHTLLRDRKGRSLVALLLFVALEYLLGRLQGLFPSPAQELVLYAENLSSTQTREMVSGLNELIPLMLPHACISLVCLLGSLFGCGWMLDKKVSL